MFLYNTEISVKKLHFECSLNLFTCCHDTKIVIHETKTTTQIITILYSKHAFFVYKNIFTKTLSQCKGLALRTFQFENLQVKVCFKIYKLMD